MNVLPSEGLQSLPDCTLMNPPFQITSTFNETQWTTASEDYNIEEIEPDAVTLLSILLVGKNRLLQRMSDSTTKTNLFPGLFLSLLIFLSVAGNILVCIAIYTERSLRRIGNLFLASLAIADLFVASLVMTFAGVNDLLGNQLVCFSSKVLI